MQRQQVVDFEAARALAQPFAFEKFVGLDPLLRHPHPDVIPHGHLNAPAPSQPLDDVVQRRLHDGIAHSGDEGHDRHSLLAGRDAGDVARSHVCPRLHPADRVRFRDLLDTHSPERLLGFSEDLTGLGVTKFTALAEERQLEPGHDTVALADRERHGRALHFDDVARDAGEQADDLIDDGLERCR